MLLAATAAPAAAAKNTLTANLTLVVRTDETNAAPVQTALRIVAPASDQDIRQLLTNGPTTKHYAGALRHLLQRSGLYGKQYLTERVALTVDRPPDVSVAGRKATVFFTGTRDLGDYVASGAPGIWDIERHGSRLRLCVAQPHGTATRWRIDLYVAGARILAARPTPDDLQRVVGVPSLGDAQTPITAPAVGEGNVRHLDWELTAATTVRAHPMCGGAPAYGIPAARNPVVVAIALPTATRALLNAFSGRWAHVRLALSYLATTVVFLLLGVVLLTPAGKQLDPGLRRGVAYSIAVWAALLCGAAVTWLVAGSSNDVTPTMRHPALVAAGCAALLAAAAVSRRWLLIVVVPVVALTAGSYVVQSDLANAYGRHGLGPIALAALPAFATAAMALVALAIVGAVPHARYTRRLVAAGLVIALVVVVQTAGAGYANWHDRHQATSALNEGQFVNPKGWVAGYLVDFGFAFVGFVADLLPVLAFALVLAVLRSLGANAPSRLFRTEVEEVVPLLAGTLFVAYVIGTQGLVYGWKTPAAFLVAVLLALVFWQVIRHPATAKVADRVAALNQVDDGAALLLSARNELLERARKLVELRSRLSSAEDDKRAEIEKRIGELEAGGVEDAPTRLPEGASPGPVALSFGPGTSWWDNAKIAATWGARLAILPMLFFVYVLLTKRLTHDLSPWQPLGIEDLVRSSLYEALFWISAALVLGLLFPYLPTTWGAVKGATLATGYTVAVGLSAWILPGASQGWAFRAFELFLFLIALGAVLDWRTIREGKGPDSYLADVYRMGDVRYVSGYASAAVGSLALITQQLQTGQGQAAITSIVKNLPVLIPPTH